MEIQRRETASASHFFAAAIVVCAIWTPAAQLPRLRAHLYYLGTFTVCCTAFHHLSMGGCESDALLNTCPQLSLHDKFAQTVTTELMLIQVLLDLCYSQSKGSFHASAVHICTPWHALWPLGTCEVILPTALAWFHPWTTMPTVGTLLMLQCAH